MRRRLECLSTFQNTMSNLKITQPSKSCQFAGTSLDTDMDITHQEFRGCSSLKCTREIKKSKKYNRYKKKFLQKGI